MAFVKDSMVSKKYYLTERKVEIFLVGIDMCGEPEWLVLDKMSVVGCVI